MSYYGSSEAVLNLIRQTYPAPCSAFRDLTSGFTGRGGTSPRVLYCVGGALYMFIHGLDPATASGRERFPNIGRIADALRELNPALDRPLANKYAIGITQANDFLPWGGRERAWRLLTRAMREPRNRRRRRRRQYSLPGGWRPGRFSQTRTTA